MKQQKLKWHFSPKKPLLPHPPLLGLAGSWRSAACAPLCCGERDREPWIWHHPAMATLCWGTRLRQSESRVPRA